MRIEECKRIVRYIEKNNIDSLVSLLDKCHINYHYNNTVRFTNNKYMMYLKYGMLTKRMFISR